MVARRRRLDHAEPPVQPPLLAAVRSLSRPLRSPADLDPLLDRIGEARDVLAARKGHVLGEAQLLGTYARRGKTP